MIFSGFFKRIFGVKDKKSVPLPNSPPSAKKTAIAGRPETPAASKQSGALLHREELLDARGRLSGYRFSFKLLDKRIQVPPGAYLDALHAANVRAFAARRMAVIDVGLDEWLKEDFRSLIAAHTVFQLKVPPFPDVSAEWLTGIAKIRESGVAVALSRVETTPLFKPALSEVSMGFVDLTAYSPANFDRLMRCLRTDFPTLKLAVENVRSWEERRLCMGLGAEYALGDFLSAPDVDRQPEMFNPSRLILIEMLNLLRSDADPEVIANVAKRDPGIAVNILSMANSPVSGLTKPIASIDQAIVVLGRDILYRWLAVSIFRAGSTSELDEALLELALARARFLELAGLTILPKPVTDELFLVGLLSFVDVLLGVPMASIVAKVKLSGAVQDVLLRSEGPYNRYLMLGITVEKGNVDKATRLASALGIQAEALDAYRSIALLWAEEALAQ